MAKPLRPSPLAPDGLPDMPEISGVSLAVARSGSKYKGRDDVMLALLPEGAGVAGVFTRSKTAAAPVQWCRDQLGEPGFSPRALLVNAGNANAFVGQAGMGAAKSVAQGVARRLGCKPGAVMLASTGVIGVPLDPGPIEAKIDELAGGLSPALWHEAAAAIMTTDTFPKLATGSFSHGSARYTINGFAKGSGMIAPDMATMLGFIFTDAPLSPHALQDALSASVRKSFNAITVDGDTSTSDTVLLFSTGAGDGESDAGLAAGFAEALDTVCIDLAHQIVRDGEGAEKFVTIDVRGAEDDRAAHVIAMAIANSPLVKTAIAGSDANWGRIVMAVGKAGEAADRDRLSVWIGGVRVAHNGMIDPDYHEEQVVDHMASRAIDIAVDVGIAIGEARVWTCDLTARYIEINADYRS